MAKIKIKPEISLSIQGIESDLKKFGETYATTIVEEAQRVITKFAKEQMVGYYGEYDPRIYDPRTNQMLNSSYKPFTDHLGNIYEGGVIINSENTEHERGSDKFSESDLYDMVWIKGIHGWEIVGYYPNYRWREIKGNPFTPDRLNRLKNKAYGNELKKN